MSSRLATWTPTPGMEIPRDGFAPLVEQITAVSASRHGPDLGRYVARYFEDLLRHLSSLRAVLAPGARLSYVIGNSVFYDVLLPTEQVYASMLRALGFQDAQVERLRKRTSKPEL